MLDLRRLTQFDTPTISNAIELFEVRPRSAGYMDGRIRACFPEMPPIAGYAATVTMRCAVPKIEGDVYGSLDEQVSRFGELPGTPIVVFQDLDDPCIAATFGEIMCSTYQAFGAAGLITSGAARDLDQVRRIGFPAFSNGAICSHGSSHIVDIQRAVRAGGVTVQPGAPTHADADAAYQVSSSGRVRRSAGAKTEVPPGCGLSSRRDSLRRRQNEPDDGKTRGVRSGGVRSEGYPSHLADRSPAAKGLRL